MRRVVGYLSVMLVGFSCADGSESNEEGATDTATETTVDECIPGEERCECNQGQCLTGLTCASNVCVSIPEDPTDPVEDESSGGAEGSGGPIPCDSTNDCPDDRVCSQSECVYAWDAAPYLVSIPEADVCPVDGSGGAEVYFEIYVDDTLAFTSASSGCPAGWGNEMFELTDPFALFRIEFWELDAFFDDFVASVCWDTFGDGACGPVPETILHDGEWTGSFGAEDAYSATVLFELVQ